MAGTTWVAPGEGSTWRELAMAFEHRIPNPMLDCFHLGKGKGCNDHIDDRTNLSLTGLPLTDYDRQRWESGNVV